MIEGLVQDSAGLAEEARRPVEAGDQALADVEIGGSVVGAPDQVRDAVELVGEGDGADGVVGGDDGGRALAIVDGVRPGVVEPEAESAAGGAVELQDQGVVGGIHIGADLGDGFEVGVEARGIDGDGEGVSVVGG